MYVKLSRMAAVVTAAAMAPAVLLASPALADDHTKAAGAPASPSAPDQSPVEKPAGKTAERPVHDGKQAERDREEILRLMAAAAPGSAVRERGTKAIDGGPAAMRAFLETGQHEARASDDRVELSRIAEGEKGWATGEAADALLRRGASPAEMRQFLEVTQHVLRDEDNRVRVSRIIGRGGPAVREAGKAALKGSAQDRTDFLKTGQYQAQASDDRVELARIDEAEDGPILSEAIGELLRGSPTPAQLRHFLEVTQYELRDQDNYLRISKIVNAGGPAVKAAGKAALKGSPQDRVDFLKTGQYEARAKDEKSADKTGTGTGTHQVVNKETTTGNAHTPATTTGGGRPLASTGSGATWAAEGAGAAIAAGAGLLLAARLRRQATTKA
ncbi:ALF repeat-containing protein [Streptomyces sp. NPDC048337]|uniref:ALF repeat-containing protein n=1 Tax=Streptomyces sp. NPDC048337 TaxID=3365535 RepID=UPI00370FE39F